MPIFKCDNCGIRYNPERDIHYKRKHFCGMACKEEYIDDQRQLGNDLSEDGLIYEPWIGEKFDP